jgi:DNA-directed RNA polymerase subunit L
MFPTVINKKQDGDNLRFTLTGTNVSLANAIRRTVLSDIPCVVIKTTPYEENQVTIHANTSHLNNEILKQRLSCIPVHLFDFKIPLESIKVECNVENTTDTIRYVTTEDFEIQGLSKEETRKIFPPNDTTEYFIDILRLKPRLSEDLPGEKVHFSFTLSTGTAKESGMYNVASSCSYQFTPNEQLINEQLAIKQQTWKDEGLTEKEIEFESENWKLLEAKRIVTKDSFDFVIQSVFQASSGIFTNEYLVAKACEIIMKKLLVLKDTIDTERLAVSTSLTTIKNCYDVELDMEDFTIGKIMEYAMYSKFYEGVGTLSFCGFVKMHPHDDGSLLRIAYKEPTDMSILFANLKDCVQDLCVFYSTVKKAFVEN